MSPHTGPGAELPRSLAAKDVDRVAGLLHPEIDGRVERPVEVE